MHCDFAGLKKSETPLEFENENIFMTLQGTIEYQPLLFLINFQTCSQPMYQIALLVAASLATLVLFSSTLSDSSPHGPLDDEPIAADQSVSGLRGTDNLSDSMMSHGDSPD